MIITSSFRIGFLAILFTTGLFFFARPVFAVQDPLCLANASANYNACISVAESAYHACRDNGGTPPDCSLERTSFRGECTRVQASETSDCPEVSNTSCVTNAQTAYNTCVSSADNTYTGCLTVGGAPPDCSQQRSTAYSTCTNNRNTTLQTCTNSSDCAGAAQREFEDCLSGSQGRRSACDASGTPASVCGPEQTTRDNACRDARTAAVAGCPTDVSVLPKAISTASIADQFSSIQSQGIIFGNICSNAGAECPCRDQGKCTLNDILQFVVNIAIFILGISGTLVLLMFIVGGFMWLLSHGNTDLVEKGKKTMTGAAIGLLIIFGSYTAITFLVKILTNQAVEGPGNTLAPGATLEDTLTPLVPEAGNLINSIQ